ncbi:HD domain-containing protein [Flagellimonas sp. 2504JD1-5]
MAEENIVEKTINFVKQTLKGAEGGHDWFHTQRVFNNAKQIAQIEEVDTLVIKLAALLHDIADPKFHNGDESVGPRLAQQFLQNQNVESDTTKHIVNIIKYMSFKNSLEPGEKFNSLELQVVQDADRLDAIGAIGIARTFNYGGFKNRELYNPDIHPQMNMSKEEYKNSNAPTINHFYEKLLLLKDKMNTETGRKLAEQRHQFMLDYLEQFYKEWNT